MTTLDYPTLEELAGWLYDEDDNPPVIREVDIDIAAEIRWEDSEYQIPNKKENEK
jgi:hypothetical protein